MSIGPPKTVASAGKDRMMGANATPAPTKPDQAGGAGVKCGSCGHYHKPGSICSNKSFDGILDLLKGNPYHEAKGKPNGGQFAKKPTGQVSGGGSTKTPVVHSGGQGTGDGIDDGKPDDPNKLSTSSGVMSKEEWDNHEKLVAEDEAFDEAETAAGRPPPPDSGPDKESQAALAAEIAAMPKDQGTKVGGSSKDSSYDADAVPVSADTVVDDHGPERAPGTPEQLANMPSAPSGSTVQDPRGFGAGDSVALDGAPLTYAGQRSATAPPVNQLERLNKERKYDQVYNNAEKQGFSPQDSHAAAALATDGHTQSTDWKTPSQRKKEAKESSDAEAAKVKELKTNAKAEAKFNQQRVTNQNKLQGKSPKQNTISQDLAIAKDPSQAQGDLSGLIGPSGTPSKPSGDKAAFRQANSALGKQAKVRQADAKAEAKFNQQAVANQAKLGKVAEAGAIKQGKMQGKDSNAAAIQDLAVARDFSSMGGNVDLPQDDLSSMIGPSGQSKMGQQRDAQQNVSELGQMGPGASATTTPTPSSGDAGKFKAANAALGKQAKTSNASTSGKPSGAGQGPSGKPAGLAQGGTKTPPTKGLPFSQMYGAGAGIGSSMTQEGGAAGPTTAFAAQRAHQMLNPDLRPHTAPTFAGTGTGARTKDKHSTGTTSALAPGMGKSVEALLGM